MTKTPATAHWLMREAIREYLDREEQVERRNAEADEAWEEYRRTGQSVSNDAMTAWLDACGTDKEGPCPDPGAEMVRRRATGCCLAAGVH